MDVLTFISNIVSSLAWSAVVVGVLFFLRKELPSIVSSLRRLKVRDVELEFGEEAKELAEETSRVVPAPKSQRLPKSDGSVSEVDQLNAVAEISPRAAILEAWLQVEAAAARFIRQQGDHSISVNPGPMRLIEGLRRSEILTPPQEAAFEHLRRLRNQAVHAPDAEFTQAAVANYIRSAHAMAVYLKDMAG